MCDGGVGGGREMLTVGTAHRLLFVVVVCWVFGVEWAGTAINKTEIGRDGTSW